MTATVQNRIILIVGFRGSGKSTLASGILRLQYWPVFLFDPHHDPAYSWIRNTAQNVEAFKDYGRWVKEAKPKQVRCRYVPDGRNDPFDELNYFCAEMWNRWSVPGWPIWVCIEEVSEACRSVGSAGMPPELRRIVNQGRHRKINQLYCGIRYAEIPRPISAGADVQILFRCQEPIDLDSMRNRIGSKATEKVQGLAQYQALLFFPGRSWQIVGSRDVGIADLVMQDGVRSHAQEE